MNIAYLISAHNDAPHLRRLIDALPREAEVFVHIDAKADIKPFLEAASLPNVHFIEQRYNIMWGSFMQVKYQMALIKSALSFEKSFDYLFSVSGLDYPLWNADKIMTYLRENNGKEFLWATCLTTKDEAETRLYREYRFLNNYCWPYGTLKSKFRVALRHIVSALGIHKPLMVSLHGKECPMYKGGSWWGISSALAHAVLDVYEHDTQFTAYFKNSFAPDETFIHTIAMNSEFARQCTLINNHSKLELLSPLTYIEYGDEIKVFTEKDYNTLMASDKMFCRKTVTGISDKLLDMIDKKIK